ncbi:ArsR/SmtB family transcription factor [Sinorhizobium medicae]|uniref:ArsR/SmtB family transcription factor n=1 Tax=Sinorhizobium medicae TaxID=110321 RepID=UPI002AF6BB84|nr:helix-turn-helix domain-containing protein [Sinorhizobium medicae]WQO48707.1 helix-turn-helix domain-containing protein [Sinorhizobium medicae]WQO68990.1 helix-turn-helix domain-containing protein [Sinorhizobium medicae]WQO77636.1 helix-turn-helix domain-containing protein [Sinorhizobium medicae]
MRALTPADHQWADERANLLRALAHPHRLEILLRLTKGEKSFRELALALGISGRSMSYSLTELCARNLVLKSRVDGCTYYTSNVPDFDVFWQAGTSGAKTNEE